jgi:hypothetical protein
VRAEVKNAATQEYLFNGCDTFFQKAANCKDIDVVVFLSFEKMEEAESRYKKQRKNMKQTAENHPNKQFILVDDIE